MSDIENPKLGFESPESGELFKNLSFFEENLRKKVQKIFPSFLAAFGLFSLLKRQAKNRPKNFFFGCRLFWLRVLGGRTNVLRRSVWSQKTSQIAVMTILHIYRE